jgi:hypothetical protein
MPLKFQRGYASFLFQHGGTRTEKGMEPLSSRMGIMDVQLLTVLLDIWYLRLQGGWVSGVRQISIWNSCQNGELVVKAHGLMVNAVNLIWSEQTILSTTPRPSFTPATYRPTATPTTTATSTKFLKI